MVEDIRLGYHHISREKLLIESFYSALEKKVPKNTKVDAFDCYIIIIRKKKIFKIGAM
jgi:hypothetical protein